MDKTDANTDIKKKYTIDKLLFNGTHKEIISNLEREIDMIANYCDKIIGEGYYGRVISSAYGPNFFINIDDQIARIDIVIKQAKIKSNISIDQMDNDLIIHCQDGIGCEAIILYILSKSWYKEENLHMPLLVAMSKCDDDEELGFGAIHNIVLEKCGLQHKIDMKKTNFFANPSILISGDPPMRSYMANIGMLIDYITLNMKHNMKCVLPNEISVDVVELIDTICIFYLHTNHFVWSKYKLTLGDQSTNNVFIHWINYSSRCGKTKLDKLENIYYDIGTQYIKTKSNGMIFKLGDVGISVMVPQPNVMVVGNAGDYGYLYPNVKKYKNKSYFFWDFIFDVIRFIPTKIMSLTVIYQIILKYDISEKYVPFVGIKEKYIKSMPSELEILNDPLYDKFKISKSDNDISNNPTTFINFLF